MKKEITKIEKKLYIITAILLSVSGAIFGLYLAEILSEYYVEKLELSQIIISNVLLSVIFAAVMLSLSKPLTKLFMLITEKLQGVLVTRPAYKNMSIVFGLIMGAILTVIGGYFIKFSGIEPAVQVIILIVAFVILTYAAVWVFEKILGSSESYRDAVRGYVISSTALSNDKILRLAPKLVGKIAVMDVTASKLSTELADAQVNGKSTEEQEKAFANYVELKKLVNLQFATGDIMKSEMENLIAISKSKKLRIIADNPLELFDDDVVDVLYLSNL